MDLSTFLVHFGYEVGLLKERGVEYADFNWSEDTFWLTPGDEIDITDITDFGFFEAKLADAAAEAYRNLPNEFKLYYLDISVINMIRLNPTEPNPDEVSKIIYQGIPHPINLYTPDGNPATLPIPEITIEPEHLPIIDAILCYQRAMPIRFGEAYKYGVPCKIRKKPDEPKESDEPDDLQATD